MCGIGHGPEQDQPEAEHDEEHGDAHRFAALFRRGAPYAARDERGLLVVLAVVSQRAAVAHEEAEDQDQAPDKVEADRDRALHRGAGERAEQQREQDSDAADPDEQEGEAAKRAEEDR